MAAGAGACKAGKPPHACWFTTKQGQRLKLAVRDARLQAAKAMDAAQLADESVEQLRAELKKRKWEAGHLVREFGATEPRGQQWPHSTRLRRSHATQRLGDSLRVSPRWRCFPSGAVHGGILVVSQL